MDNQHKKIKGYRELNQQEIDLMNKIKEHGEQTNALLLEIGKVMVYLDCDRHIESTRCQRLSKDNLQTGQMWLVRAVALPESF